MHRILLTLPLCPSGHPSRHLRVSFPSPAVVLALVLV